MSSGAASVRAADGICLLRGIYLSARDGCEAFRAAPVLAPVDDRDEATRRAAAQPRGGLSDPA